MGHQWCFLWVHGGSCNIRPPRPNDPVGIDLTPTPIPAAKLRIHTRQMTTEMALSLLILQQPIRAKLLWWCLIFPLKSGSHFALAFRSRWRRYSAICSIWYVGLFFIYPTDLAIGSTVYSCPSFKEINSDGFSSPRILLTWPSLLTDMPRIFLYQRFVFSNLSTVLSTRNSQPMSSALENRFLTKIYFFVIIIHFSVNFTSFVLLSHKNFDDRPLFKSGVLS